LQDDIIMLILISKRYDCIIMSKKNMTRRKLESFITSRKIVTFQEISEHLNTTVRITIIRRLKELPYISSYSHKGKYYTLDTVAKFSDEGLWCYNSVYFSKFNTLINTCCHFVNNSECGFTVKELQKKLHVEVKLALLTLYKNNKLHREKYRGEYVYFNKSFPRRKQQIIIRGSQSEATVLNIDKLSSHVITDDLKAAIILFYSILDEKQRRLYAGLESLKIGHGGDKLISSLLRLDPETVSNGRKELISGQFEKDSVRKTGGGRTAIKKNSRNN